MADETNEKKIKKMKLYGWKKEIMLGIRVVGQEVAGRKNALRKLFVNPPIPQTKSSLDLISA